MNIPHTWIELSKQAFDHNIEQYKRIIGLPSSLAVVIKSNAYGHGLNEIAPLCEKNPAVGWLCTTSLSEALQLRKLGVTKGILVMGLIDDDIEQLLINNIDVVAFSINGLQELNNCAVRLGIKARVHLKIDTGMSRFGFTQDEVLPTIAIIRTLLGISLQSIFTHFCESESANQEFTALQLERFAKLVSAINSTGIGAVPAHSCNSAATINQPDAHFDMVRIGAGAYGLVPSASTHAHAQATHPSFSVRPVMTWKARVLHTRIIPAGTPIGYGRTHITERDTLIALLPIGYYEGYDRRFSNKGRIFFEKTGVYGTVAGRVCMNFIMVALPPDAVVHVGDIAIVLGEQHDVQAHVLAQSIESHNPREITTRINPIIPRFVI